MPTFLSQLLAESYPAKAGGLNLKFGRINEDIDSKDYTWAYYEHVNIENHDNEKIDEKNSKTRGKENV